MLNSFIENAHLTLSLKSVSVRHFSAIASEVAALFELSSYLTSFIITANGSWYWIIIGSLVNGQEGSAAASRQPER